MKTRILSVISTLALLIGSEVVNPTLVPQAQGSASDNSIHASSVTTKILGMDENGNQIVQAGVSKEYQQVAQKQDSEAKKNGFLPMTSLYASLSKQAQIKTNTSKGLLQAQSIPSSYDSRKGGNVPSFVKYQTGSNCWAYSAYASLESGLLIKGDTTGWNFDEEYMTAHSGWSTSYGGSDTIATAFLTSWNGPQSLNANGSETGVQKHIQNVAACGSRSGYSATADAVMKAYVIKYGALSASFYYSSNYLSNANYYYASSATTYSNHEVAVIGWDDNYSASNFSASAAGTPKHNGAFLCRNSWGSSFGNGGYFWVSYDDTTFGQDGFHAYYGAESTSNYDTNYQYDALAGADAGATDTYGSSSVQGAELFTATASQDIKAVSVTTFAPNYSYSAYIITNVDASRFASDSLYQYQEIRNASTLVASGVEAEAGFHTIGITSTSVSKGSSFVIWLKLTSPDGSAALFPGSYSCQDENGDALVKVPLTAGHSFMYSGSMWFDTTVYSNFITSIKAYGVNDSSVSDSPAASTSTSTPVSTTYSPILNIDTPSTGSVCSSDVTVGGWALNQKRNAAVTVSVNGTQVASTSAFTARTDVHNVVDPNSHYANSVNCGFSVVVPLSKLVSGNNSITVTAIGEDGNNVSKTVAVTKNRPNPITDIDAPSSGSVNPGDFKVSGWALNAAGISRLDMYAQDSSGGMHWLTSVSGSSMTNRGDVANLFASAGYANVTAAGYSTTLSGSLLSAGNYTLCVAAIGNDGSVQWATQNFSTGSNPLTDVDAPGGYVSGDFAVSGWALNHSGINRVDVYAFDSSGTAHFLGTENSSAFTDRKDVASAFASSGFTNKTQSGYSVNVSASSLKAGNYTLAVAGIGNDGSVCWSTRSLTVGDVPLTDIDAPYGTAESKFTVSGWVLNHSGLNQVAVYLWDSNGNPHLAGSVNSSSFTNRQDVANVFASAGYKNKTKSGYSLTVDRTALNLPAGRYTVSVAGIGNDGDVKWNSTSVQIS